MYEILIGCKQMALVANCDGGDEIIDGARLNTFAAAEGTQLSCSNIVVRPGSMSGNGSRCCLSFVNCSSLADVKTGCPAATG